jgi:hypothetical protein
MFVRGMGIGFAFMPAMAAAFASLERSELADATPQLNVLQRVGGSIGTALLAVVLQRALVGVHTLEGAAQAYGTAFWVAGGLTAVAIVPCIILLRAERAARQTKTTAAGLRRTFAPRRWRHDRRPREALEHLCRRSVDQRVSARPKAGKRSEPNVVISAIAVPARDPRPRRRTGACGSSARAARGGGARRGWRRRSRRRLWRRRAADRARGRSSVAVHRASWRSCPLKRRGPRQLIAG